MFMTSAAAYAVSGMLIYDQCYCDKWKHINTADYITSYDNTNPPLITGSH